MQIPPLRRSAQRTSLRTRPESASRRSEAAGMLGRTFFCVVAFSTPYAMFLLNGALHP